MQAKDPEEVRLKENVKTITSQLGYILSLFFFFLVLVFLIFSKGKQIFQAMHWKDIWEQRAKDTFIDYMSKSEDELLNLIQNTNWDSYYSIWKAIGKKGSKKKAAPILFEVIKSQTGENDDLIRYHCAAALFKILHIEYMDELRKTVQWNIESREKEMIELEQIINGPELPHADKEY